LGDEEFSRERHCFVFASADCVLPGIFISILFVLTIKLRKSPFDLSTSHHAHQELVKGLTTEFSGSSLAMIEVAHWYENIMLLGFVYLFFASSRSSALRRP